MPQISPLVDVLFLGSGAAALFVEKAGSVGGVLHLTGVRGSTWKRMGLSLRNCRIDGSEYIYSGRCCMLDEPTLFRGGFFIGG